MGSVRAHLALGGRVATGGRIGELLDTLEVFLCLAVAAGAKMGEHFDAQRGGQLVDDGLHLRVVGRSEEHTSELPSLMRLSYAVFCLKKKHFQHHDQQTTTELKT